MLGRTFPAIVAIGLLIPTISLAQPLAGQLPRDTILYFGWSGAENLGPGYEESHLKALIELSQINRMIGDVLPQAIAKISDELPDEDARRASEVFSTVGLALWKHPTAFYFGGVDFSGPQPTPQAAVVCEAGKDAKALHDQIAQLIDEAGDSDFPIELRKLGNRVVLTIGNLSADQQGALGLIQTFAPVPSLNDNKQFKAALKRTVKDPVMVAYLDGERLWKMIDKGVAFQVERGEGSEEEAQQWQKAKESLGLEGFKRAIFASGFDGQRWGSRAFVEAPAPRRGLMALLDQQPLTDEILGAVPDSASIAGAGNLDLAGLFDFARGLVQEFDPRATESFDEGLQQISEGVGIDLMDDLLKPLGGQWAFYIDKNHGANGLFGSIVVNRLRDADRFKETLAKLHGMANQLMAQQFQEEEFSIRIKTAMEDGTELHYVALPLISPTWSIRNGNLYLGMQPQFVASAAHHVASGGKSIAANKDFKEIRKQVGADQIGGFSFVDVPKIAPESYAFVTMMSRLLVGFADMAEIEDVPTMMVPPMYKLKPHLTATASFSWADDDGYYVRSLEAFPGSGVFAVGGAGGLWTMYSMMLPVALFTGTTSALRIAE